MRLNWEMQEACLGAWGPDPSLLGPAGLSSLHLVSQEQKPGLPEMYPPDAAQTLNQSGLSFGWA